MDEALRDLTTTMLSSMHNVLKIAFFILLRRRICMQALRCLGVIMRGAFVPPKFWEVPSSTTNVLVVKRHLPPITEIIHQDEEFNAVWEQLKAFQPLAMHRICSITGRKFPLREHSPPVERQLQTNHLSNWHLLAAQEIGPGIVRMHMSAQLKWISKTWRSSSGEPRVTRPWAQICTKESVPETCTGRQIDLQDPWNDITKAAWCTRKSDLEVKEGFNAALRTPPHIPHWVVEAVNSEDVQLYFKNMSFFCALQSVLMYWRCMSTFFASCGSSRSGTTCA